jgi:hypothetical protein
LEIGKFGRWEVWRKGSIEDEKFYWKAEAPTSNLKFKLMYFDIKF